MGRECQLWHRRIKQHLVIQLVTADVHTFISLANKAYVTIFLPSSNTSTINSFDKQNKTASMLYVLKQF